MAGSRPFRSIPTEHEPEPLPNDSRFERRMAEILAYATDVFYEKGYEGASMRDLSRVSGMSLAGLYYYFKSKERLLYLIQKHAFETILQQLETRLQNVSDPEQRLRLFISNHLQYFLANQKAMTVLSHEDEVLKGPLGDEIRVIKKQYYHLCRELVESLKSERRLETNTRVAVLALFGMMNWIYTWYRPQVDMDAHELSDQMADIFLRGILAGRKGPKRDAGERADSRAAANTGNTASPKI